MEFLNDAKLREVNNESVIYGNCNKCGNEMQEMFLQQMQRNLTCPTCKTKHFVFLDERDPQTNELQDKWYKRRLREIYVKDCRTKSARTVKKRWEVNA